MVHTKFTCGTTSKYIWLQVILWLCAWHTSRVNHEFATEGCITANKNSKTWLNASIPNKESVQTGPTNPYSVPLCWGLSTSQNVGENACCVWACVVPPTVQDTLHFMHWKVMNSSDISPRDYHVFDPRGLTGWCINGTSASVPNGTIFNDHCVLLHNNPKWVSFQQDLKIVQ
jgi:hypothetical protein